MYRKLTTAAAVAALAFGLAACGGGGSDGPTASAPPPPATPDPMPPAPVAVTLPSDGNMYLDADELMLSDATMTVAAGDSADVGPYTLTCSDAGPCEVTIADGEVMATGEVTAAYSTAAMTTIAAAKSDAMDESDGRAMGLAEALTTSDGVNDIFGVGAAALTITPVQIPQAGALPATGTDIVVTRGLTGDVMVTRDRAGWHGDATAAASVGAGWGGQVLSNVGPRSAQTLTVHSNIANAVRQDFEADTAPPTSIYALNQAAGAIGHLPTADTSNAAAGLTLDAAAMQAAYSQGLLDPRFFPGPGATGSRTVTYTYSNANPTPGPRNYALSFPGTFHGASGLYTCQTDPCTIAVTPANLTAPATYAATNGWTFTPDREATNGNDAQLHRQDNNWLSFGWWINEPAGPRPGGAFLYNAQVFYGGAQQFAAANLAAGVLNRLNLNYTGPAGGLYARQANAATGVTSARGEFTADATLTARYGVAAGTDVSGSITNFANGDGVDMSGWSLTLARTPVAAGTSGATGAAAGSVSSGDSTNRAGRWEYTLYGPARGQEYPTGVAGRFFASIDATTAVAGAFGAE